MKNQFVSAGKTVSANWRRGRPVWEGRGRMNEEADLPEGDNRRMAHTGVHTESCDTHILSSFFGDCGCFWHDKGKSLLFWSDTI